MRFGLGYRRRMSDSIWRHASEIDSLELITEHFIPLTESRRREIESLKESFTLIPHGLGLSIGSVDRPPAEYMDMLARVVRVMEPDYYSDHFAITDTARRRLGHLSPIWCTHENLEVTIRNVEVAQDLLGVQLVLETITQPFRMPHRELSENEFIRVVAERTGCGILLDVTNVLINEANLSIDSSAYITSLPASAVKQYHLVGYGSDDYGDLVDSHSHAIQEKVWDMFERSLAHAPPDNIIIERDDDAPDVSDMVEEIRKAKKLVRETCTHLGSVSSGSTLRSREA